MDFSYLLRRHLNQVAGLGLGIVAVCGCSGRETGVYCIDVDGDVCPSTREARDQIEGVHVGRCGSELKRVTDFYSSGTAQTCDTAEGFVDTGGGTCRVTFDDPTRTRCCYSIVRTEEDRSCTVVDGRPLMDDGVVRLAPLARNDAWLETVEPGLAGLTASECAILARHWAGAAQAEHASVASFSRFALDLLAHGAPPALVDGAHAAARDEVRHARLCFGLAAAYSGEPRGPGPLEQAPYATAATLADLAESTAREAAINETLAVVRAAERLRTATDPAVRRALSIIVEDETRHAELAWATLRWAVDTGGEPVRARLAQVFDGLEPAPAGPDDASDSEALRAHGRTSRSRLARATDEALRGVVLPAGRALLEEAKSGRFEAPRSPVVR